MHSNPGLAAVLAAEVRRARHDQQLRQDELALAAGVSVRSIHHIESGKPTTRLDVVERVIDALGLSIEIRSRHESDSSRRRH
jgi:y4mF family transcriptional regulator